MAKPGPYCEAPGLDLDAVQALGVYRLAAPVDIPVVWIICHAPPDWTTLSAIQARISAQTTGPLRPGMDHWRQWSNHMLAAARGDALPPIGAFVTVTDRDGWRARLHSGDHALELTALAAGDLYGEAATWIAERRAPTVADLVYSPSEGVLTFQQILVELICNYGLESGAGPIATALGRVTRTLVGQTMRNALALDDPVHLAMHMPREVRTTFLTRYPHWADHLPRPGLTSKARVEQAMRFFERIAEEGSGR